MKLKTITTIELSSLCNLSCKYCINRLLVKHPMRSPGIMTGEIFNASLDILKKLCLNGTQQEVNLNGNGESTLDDQLIKRIKKTKEVIGNRTVTFCTNGVNMTAKLAEKLKNVGLDMISLSPHNLFHARKAAHLLADSGFTPFINFGSICASHNWAGQLEPENSIDCKLKNDCKPLEEGRGYISSEGYISPCCYDYKLIGVYAHVLDDDIFEKEVAPYSLCHMCHQRINKDLQKQYNFVQ